MAEGDTVPESSPAASHSRTTSGPAGPLTLRTRAWTASDGEERTKLEILAADEIGPSLRWATTEVTKTSA